MSLPLQWVDRIFEKMIVTYGSSFLNRWRDIDLNTVKSDWAHDLAGFEKTPHAIAYGLANLPDSPPTVTVFRSICRQAPAKEEALALPPPKADPARVAAEFAKLAPMREARQTTNSAEERGAWARRILARKEAGAKVSPTVLAMAKEGLKNLGLAA